MARLSTAHRAARSTTSYATDQGRRASSVSVRRREVRRLAPRAGAAMTRTHLRLVLVCACIAVFLFAGCMAAVRIATSSP